MLPDTYPARRERMAAAHQMETVLNLRGLRCPQPVLRAKKALRNIPSGGILVLECTDPLTVIDVPLFARQTGHALSEQVRRGDLYIFKIVKSGKQEESSPGE
ncbi:MAG: sulfurtransferase TusA family protein [Hyphomicrobiales bacterium]